MLLSLRNGRPVPHFLIPHLHGIALLILGLLWQQMPPIGIIRCRFLDVPFSRCLPGSLVVEPCIHPPARIPCINGVSLVVRSDDVPADGVAQGDGQVLFVLLARCRRGFFEEGGDKLVHH